MLFICDYSAKYGGNFLASFIFLANKLAEQNIEVYFIFPQEAKNQNWEIDLSEFNVIYSKFSKEDLIITIKQCLQKNDCGIIHLNFLSSLLIVKMKRELSDRRVAFAFHQHMAVNYGLKQIVKGIILRTFAPKNTAYIAVSPEVYKNVKKEVGSEKSYLVTNAIDIDRLSTINHFDNHNILIFGTDFMRKGVDLAIEAIQHSNIDDKCKLLVVTHKPEDARQLILDKFNEIPAFVQIIPPVQNIEKLYHNSFLFLSPSRSEAFGYAVVEAAYSGNQVIASDVPGQNILAAIPGVQMIQSENVNQLRAAILKAFAHRCDNRDKLNQAASKYIVNHFSLGHWADEILDIYKSL